MTEEEWRPVVGFEGLYEVSSLGRVRSLDRVVVRSNGVPQKIAERIRKSQYDRFGYLRVNLRKDGLARTHLVHRTVAEAFIPNPEGLPYVLHGDGNPENNRVGNLRWGSPSDNMYDRTRHGTHHNSKTHCKHGHELTPDNVYRPPAAPRSRYCRACRRRRGRTYYLNQLEEDRG